LSWKKLQIIAGNAEVSKQNIFVVIQPAGQISNTSSRTGHAQLALMHKQQEGRGRRRQGRTRGKYTLQAFAISSPAKSIFSFLPF
jgi:hypothetical protein